MSGRRAVWEVARRELVERSRSRVLRISVVLLLILSAGGAVAAARLTDQTPTDKVGLVGARSAALRSAIQAQAKIAGRRVQLHPFTTAPAAERAVRDGAIDLALLDGSRIVVKTSRTIPSVRVVEQAIAAQGVIDRLRAAGLTQTQALSALSPPAPPVSVLEPRPASYDRNQPLVAIGLMALFMMLEFFGPAVAQGVTEEKSSRVVELLLTSVSPRRLLAGKILGIGLLGLALLLMPAAVALAAGRLAGGAGLPSAAPEATGLILLWFVLGYIFYSVAFAAVGALVSRQEDLNTAMLPVSAILIGAFYLAVFVVNTNPNGTLARVAAFLPPFSPMVVPARMVLGDMNAFGLAIAIALEVIGTAGLVVFAARAYERAILRIGAPIKLHRLFATPSQHGTTERPQLSPRTDAALRIFALALVIAGALIGFDRPVAIVLVAVGLLILALEQTFTPATPRRALKLSGQTAESHRDRGEALREGIGFHARPRWDFRGCCARNYGCDQASPPPSLSQSLDIVARSASSSPAGPRWPGVRGVCDEAVTPTVIARAAGRCGSCTRWVVRPCGIPRSRDGGCRRWSVLVKH